MSHVEGYATRIKIESSNQSPFWRLIKGSGGLWTANQWINNTYLQFNVWPFENQALKSLRREWSSFADQNLDPGHKRLNRWHVSDYPLVLAGVYYTVI